MCVGGRGGEDLVSGCLAVHLVEANGRGCCKAVGERANPATGAESHVSILDRAKAENLHHGKHVWGRCPFSGTSKARSGTLRLPSLF